MQSSNSAFALQGKPWQHGFCLLDNFSENHTKRHGIRAFFVWKNFCWLYLPWMWLLFHGFCGNCFGTLCIALCLLQVVKRWKRCMRCIYASGAGFVQLCLLVVKFACCFTVSAVIVRHLLHYIVFCKRAVKRCKRCVWGSFKSEWFGLFLICPFWCLCCFLTSIFLSAFVRCHSFPFIVGWRIFGNVLISLQPFENFAILRKCRSCTM